MQDIYTADERRAWAELRRAEAAFDAQQAAAAASVPPGRVVIVRTPAPPPRREASANWPKWAANVGVWALMHNIMC